MIKRGYTLIEILVVLTIVGILFGVGYASFRDFSRREALAGASKRVIADIRLAQDFALGGKKPNDAKCNGKILGSYGFRVTPPNLYSVEANCTGGTVVTKTGSLPSGVTFTAPMPNPVLFKTLGDGTNIPEGFTADIVFTQDVTNNQSTVSISSSGEVQ